MCVVHFHCSFVNVISLTHSPLIVAAKFTRSDLVLPTDEWSRLVVGELSPWLRLDAPCARRRAAAHRTLAQEMSWAAHLCLPAVLVRVSCIMRHWGGDTL